MIKLKTEVNVQNIPVHVDYHRKFLMIGSCFAENIGIKLEELLFPVIINPLGIVYNPMSCANSLEILMNERLFYPEDLFFANGLWNSFYHHSRFSHPDQKEALNKINRSITEAHEHLKQSSTLFITFGTSWVFEENRKGMIVSNCHKLPSDNFHHYRLKVDQVVERWIEVIQNLRKFNPLLSFVFTVSPIRHLRIGANENQLSKSVLLLAIDELVNHFKNERLYYYPSYEIVLDELRDYRFYAPDMVHLNDVGKEILVEKFRDTFIHSDHEIVKEIEKIRAALKHRPLYPQEEEYQKFVNSQIEKISQLKKRYPYINFNKIKFSEQKEQESSIP